MKTVISHVNLIDCVEPKVRPDSAVLNPSPATNKIS